MSTTEDQIKKMYGSQLTSQKAQLDQNYTQADADLTLQKEKLQKATDENLRRTSVDAQKAAMNNAEYHAANGLSSGAKAQARLSMGNQLQANLTALRTSQQEADAEIERQRGLLAKEYASAIQKAQADNDLAMAQALYEDAQRKEEQMLAKQEAGANLLAQYGDFSGVGSLYGLTPAQVAKLTQDYTTQKERPDKEAAASLMAQYGDFSGVGALYGLTPAQISLLSQGYNEEKNAPKQEAAASLMAQYGDFSGVGALYGLTPAQISLLSQGYNEEKNAPKQEAAASLMAQYGDFSGVGALYGLTPAQISLLSQGYNEEKNAPKQEAAASLMAQYGDFSGVGALYGLTPAQISLLSQGYNEEKNAPKQEAAASLMAQYGDFSGVGALYGLTPAQISLLSQGYNEEKNAPKQEAAASLMAQYGDFSGVGALYGLTPAQIAALNQNYATEKELPTKEAAAQLLAQTGDYSRLGALYGLSAAEIQKLSGASSTGNTGTTSSTSTGKKPVVEQASTKQPSNIKNQVSANSFAGKANNGDVDTANIIAMQRELNVDQDGKWGPETREAAYKKWDTADPNEAWAKMGGKLGVTVSSFKTNHMTREQAISRGIGETAWKAMILKALNDANLTAEEFAELEEYYGIS